MWMWVSIAAAGGPWTLGQDDRAIFVGVNHTQWSKFRGGTGAGDPLAPGTSVLRTEFGLTVSYGLLPSVTFELEGGLAYTTVGNNTVATCQDLPFEPCDDVLGLVPIAGHGRFRVLDELAGAPVTLSLGPLVRFGAHTRPQRAQLTQIGEGQTDIGGLVSVGRTGAFGKQGSFALFAEGDFVWRTPSVYVNEQLGPGPAASALVELLVSPTYPVAVAFDVSYLVRPAGLDFEDTDLDSQDRFTALAINRLELGPKFIFRSSAPLSFVVGGRFTARARNNPTDGWTLTAGVGRFFAHRDRSDGP